MHPSAPGNEAACLTFSRPGEGCCGAPRPLIRPPNAPHCPSRGRRATNDQTFEGRKENLNQANKLSRTFATCRWEAPKGNRNAWKHGRYNAEAIARRRSIAELIRQARELVR
jgi:hypothetical protein